MKETVRLTSRQNEAVKFYIKLRDSAKLRRENLCFTAEGARLCLDAVVSLRSVKSVFYTDTAYEKYREYIDKIVLNAENVYIVSDSVGDNMSDVKNSQGIFAVCPFLVPRSMDELSKKKSYIAGERIQDPSNLGAIFRTAEALGIDGAILSSDCCDVYSPKTVRASMGAVFRLPIYKTDNLPETVKELSEKGFETYASTPHQGAENIVDCNFSGGITVLGNEGAGISEEAENACRHKVSIPMLGRAESLNVSAASVIIMWEMMRGQGDISG